MHKQVHMVGLPVELAQLSGEVATGVRHETLAGGGHLVGEHRWSIQGVEHLVCVQRGDGAAAALHVEFCSGRRHVRWVGAGFGHVDRAPRLSVSAVTVLL